MHATTHPAGQLDHTPTGELTTAQLALLLLNRMFLTNGATHIPLNNLHNLQKLTADEIKRRLAVPHGTRHA